MLTETADYETLYRDFRWNIPARFNIATACCDRHADGTRSPGADLCRRGRRRHAHLVRRAARAVEPLRQCAEGRWPRPRRPRRGVPVAVAGTADRPSRGVPLRARVGAAVHAVRRGRAGISPRQFRREGGGHRRRRLGEAREDPRPAAGAEEDLRHRRARAGRRQIVLVVDRGRVRPSSRPSTPRPTIPPSSSTPRAPREIRKARCMPIACCSAICPTSRWCTTSCRSPAT